jgi:hypothetical protein
LAHFRKNKAPNLSRVSQWQLREIKERVGEHDTRLNHIYDAMENLLDEQAAQKKNPLVYKGFTIVLPNLS